MLVFGFGVGVGVRVDVCGGTLGVWLGVGGGVFPCVFPLVFVIETMFVILLDLIDNAMSILRRMRTCGGVRCTLRFLVHLMPVE